MKIKVKINGAEVEMEADEARRVFYDLSKVFGGAASVEPAPVVVQPVVVPVYPFWHPTPVPFPWWGATTAVCTG